MKKEEVAEKQEKFEKLDVKLKRNGENKRELIKLFFPFIKEKRNSLNLQTRKEYFKRLLFYYKIFNIDGY